MDIEIKELHCQRCGHKWIPRQITVRLCPKCKSPYWDTPRVRHNAFKKLDVEERQLHPEGTL